MSLVYVVSSLDDDRYRVVRAVTGRLDVAKSFAAMRSNCPLDWHDEAESSWAIERPDGPLWEVVPHDVLWAVLPTATGEMVKITGNIPVIPLWTG
jgi:hypothetical protein